MAENKQRTAGGCTGGVSVTLGYAPYLMQHSFGPKLLSEGTTALDCHLHAAWWHCTWQAALQKLC